MQNVKNKEIYIINIKNSNIFRVLICISNNTATDKLIQRIQIRVSNDEKFKNAIIIRMYSVNTKI